MKFAIYSLLVLIIAANEIQSDIQGRCKRQTGNTCFLMPQATEGPFYWSTIYNRPNLTEDRLGIPFTLRITVIEVDTCRPIPRAAVDIWHCDAGGLYSHFVNASLGSNGGGPPPGMNGTRPPGPPGRGNRTTDNSTFLRGLQVTDNDGQATFYSIYPGWYNGRATHIHIKVHINGTVADANGVYTGGHVSHTGQLFFDDMLTNQIALLAPYNSRNITRVLNDHDGIFNGEGGHSSLLSVKFMDESLGYSGGVMASITLGINSSSIPKPIEGGGGGTSSHSNLGTLINSVLILFNFFLLFLS